MIVPSPLPQITPLAHSEAGLSLMADIIQTVGGAEVFDGKSPEQVVAEVRNGTADQKTLEKLDSVVIQKTASLGLQKRGDTLVVKEHFCDFEVLTEATFKQAPALDRARQKFKTFLAFKQHLEEVAAKKPEAGAEALTELNVVAKGPEKSWHVWVPPSPTQKSKGWKHLKGMVSKKIVVDNIR